MDRKVEVLPMVVLLLNVLTTICRGRMVLGSTAIGTTYQTMGNYVSKSQLHQEYSTLNAPVNFH
ncbi:hypothetical protein MAR_011847 [Mya arenaria]|uniref:Uncharacterized protein n=1 Tax=Mya arenaria TaxID=6604 RepID=A0ABY7FVB3_MYAAR|nr:hypothetical protein MAR_011847 [Mya arenaria]